MTSFRQRLESYWSKYLRVNLAVALFCLALIGLVWAATVERVRFERTETIANATKQNANLAIAFEEQTIRTLKGIEQAVLFVKDQYDEHGLKLNIRRMIEGGAIDAGMFTFINVIDEHGDLVLGSDDFKPVNVADREYFKFHQQQDQNQMFVGKPVLGRVTGKWTIHMTRRIDKPDGSFAGVVLAAVDPGYFIEFYQKTDLGEQGLVTLVGLDGITRARRVGQAGSYGQDMRNSTLLAEQAKSGAGNFLGVGNIEGVPRFYSYRTLRQYPLIVAVGTSQAETLATFHQRERNYYIVATLTSGLGLLFMAGLMAALSQRRRREEDLQRFRVAMDASADAIYLVDRASMRFVDVNEAACRMRNLTREKLLALGPAGALSMPREELERTYDSIIAGGPGGEPVEMLRRRKDGTQVWVELRRRAQRSGESWMIVTVVRDITEHKQAEQALRESAEKLRLFADNVPAMTISYDENLRCRFANKAFAEFFGFTVENILGKHLREVVGEEAYREIEGHFVQVLQGHPVTYQRTRKLANGESRYLEVKLLPHIGDQGKVLGWFSVVTDITEHKLAEERIQLVAHHDSLTGLPNRLLFNDRLNQAISLAKRDSRQFALLYLDLDRFKPVNDTLGHTAGDALLQAAAARIRHQVRESDTVARVGGDEFTVILPDIAGREEAETVARKIIAALAAPFQLGSQKQSVDIGTSIGIALYPADAPDADALVTAADGAMYSAKQAGSSFRFCGAWGRQSGGRK